MNSLTNLLVLVLIAHPFVASLLWTTHGLVYLIWSHRAGTRLDCDEIDYSVIIPFHNEPAEALATAWSLAAVFPRPREIVLVDDGSTYGLAADAELPPGARLMRLERNGGKARALNTAFRTLDAEIVVCLDADTKAVSQDWRGMLAKFCDPTVGAISGKIWPLALRGLTQRIQQLDYASVIGLIKAAETSWGTLMTVSGAFVAFRRSALASIGGWRETTATEDIDASWRLQSEGWRLGYDFRWIARVEMVPSLPGLWRQRRRWSMGMGRTVRDHMLSAFRPRARQLPVAVLSSLNILWVILTLVAAVQLAASGLVASPPEASLAPSGQAISTYLLASALVFGAQFLCAAAIYGRPWRMAAGLILVAPLYPLYFWGILYTSFLAGFPRGFLRCDLGRWRRTQRLREAVQEGGDA
jgi:biofilm PGA synthesis N-glycosyltransferase PgaC